MKRIFFLFLVLLPFVANAYISPGSPSGFVNDFAGVLSAAGKQELEALLADYEAQTGNEISVAIIQELKNETIETYAVRLFKEWGIGKKGADNGVLFLIAISDREMKIEVGYGLEGDLTDIESKRIVSDIVPQYFRSEDWDQGVRAGVIAMIDAIGAEYAPSSSVAPDPDARDSGGFAFGDYFWILFFAPIWLGSVFARSRSWWLGGVVGAVVGGVMMFFNWSWIWIIALAGVGLLFDWLVSTKYQKMFTNKDGHHSGLPWFLLMGGGPHKWDKPGGFGGFGGFGGGSSGGGGASGRW